MKFALRTFATLTAGAIPILLFSCAHPQEPSLPVGPRVDASVRNTTTAAYRIQSGDLLKIDFSYHPEFNRSVTVRNDAMITLPVIGDYRAVGLSPDELAARITSSYHDILRHPQATVELAASPQQVAYIGGEVRNPGMYPVHAGKSALQCVIQAGGTTPEASLNRVFILRDQGSPEPLVIALQNDGRMRDLELQPKDIVVVPKSGIANANQFVDQYFNKLLPFSKSLGLTYFIGEGIN